MFGILNEDYDRYGNKRFCDVITNNMFSCKVRIKLIVICLWKVLHLKRGYLFMTIFIFIIVTSILNVFAFSFEKEMFLHLERDLRLFVYNFF